MHQRPSNPQAVAVESCSRVTSSGSAVVVRLESTLNATAFYEQFGFREVGRSTARRNDVDIAVVIMERHGQGAEAGRRKRKSKLESL